MDTKTLERRDADAQNGAPRSQIIQRTLDALAGKIRRYVIIHGLMLAMIWLCLTYWIVLALDYVPVWLGQPELSRGVRMVLLFATVIGAGWILYRYVFQRVQKQLSPNSLALLLERRFPQLNDSLATVVDNPAEADDELLEKARQHAEYSLKQIALVDVFNYRPIIVGGLLSLVLLGSIGWFATANRDAFATSFKRMYFLNSETWPRDCHVQLLGIKIKHDYSVEGIEAFNQVQAFADDEMFVGKSSAVSLMVQAELPRDDVPRRRLPSRCEFQYRTANGNSGRLTMSKVGGSQAGFQNYALDSDILQSLAEDLTFYIRGDDHRIGPFALKVVEPPLLQDLTVDCRYPDYLADDESGRFSRRKLKFASGMQLPIGSATTVQAVCDRPLSNVWILDAQDQLKTTQPFQNDSTNASVDIELPPLDKDGATMSVVLRDANGVFSRAPQPIRFQTKLDSMPVVTSQLNGIGSAVTPNAQILVTAEIQEDYGLDQVWQELTITESEQVGAPIRIPVSHQSTSENVSVLLDLQKRFLNNPLPTNETQIELRLFAKDRFDLDGQSNIGGGDAFVLNVVTSDQLLRILERDEAEQRARLEQIHREVIEARDHIVRARRDPGSSATSGSGFEPGDSASGPEVESPDDESLQLRQLFAQRAFLQTQKSTAELQGVADAFRNLRLQLINNRIDAEDRKIRLQKKVVEPLDSLTKETMEQLETALRDCDVAFRELANNPNSLTANDTLDANSLLALNKAENAIEEIRSVLDSLLKFETQNELLDIVRRLLAEQKALEQRTKALREKEAFDDIFNK